MSQESFVIDDEASIHALTVNDKGVENAGASYRLLILELLKPKGWVLKSDVKDAILRNFGPSFGPDDLKLKKVGRNGAVPKWSNMLDWAIVHGRKAGEFFSNKEIIVSAKLVHLTEGILEPRSKNMFKVCKRCKTKSKLSAACCVGCGQQFRKTNAKKLRIPLGK